MIPNNKIIAFLSSQTSNAKFIDRLKIRYRPIICPFNMLLSFANESNHNVGFDIGCGSGQFVSLLAEFTSLKEIYGIEISPELIKNAKELKAQHEDTKTHFEIFDGQCFPDTLSESDIVYLIDVVHHIPENKQVDFLKNIYFKMKPNAVLILKDIDKDHPYVYFNKLHDLIFAGEIGKELSMNSAAKKIEEIGFRIIERFKKTIFVYPHYFLICKK